MSNYYKHRKKFHPEYKSNATRNGSSHRETALVDSTDQAEAASLSPVAPTLQRTHPLGDAARSLALLDAHTLAPPQAPAFRELARQTLKTVEFLARLAAHARALPDVGELAFLIARIATGATGLEQLLETLPPADLAPLAAFAAFSLRQLIVTASTTLARLVENAGGMHSQLTEAAASLSRKAELAANSLERLSAAASTTSVNI